MNSQPRTAPAARPSTDSLLRPRPELEPPSPPPRAPVVDAVVFGLIAAAIYVIAAPRILYGPDAFTFYQMAQQGGAVHWMHVLYLPVLRLAVRVTEPFGIEPFRALAGASAVATGLGLALLHRGAARLGATRAQAIALLVLVGTTPAVAFFAVLLEVQGVFFGAVCIAWLATTAFVAAPRARHVLAIGLATGLAALVHASGHVLPIAAAAFGLAMIDLRALGLARLVCFGVVGAAAHFALPAAAQLAGFDILGSTSNSAAFVSGSTQGAGGLEHFGVILRNEWLLSFAPSCLAVYAALRVPSLRRLLAAIHVPFAVYLFVAWALLGYTFGVHGIEHGAYFLPLAFPLAWLTVRSIPWPGVLALALLGAASSWAHVRHETGERAALYEPSAVIEALGSDAGLLVVQDAKDGELLALDAPRLALIPFDVIVGGAPRSFDEIVAQLAVQIDDLHRQGRPVAFASRVYDPLLAVDDALPRWLAQRYVVEPRRVRGFRCYAVVPKPR
ncbi:MAG: hypothetical protein IT457_12075 [Planctomycetes bacterium]|nr:hypothetical protein [Planctomycetota bacterium]